MAVIDTRKKYDSGYNRRALQVDRSIWDYQQYQINEQRRMEREKGLVKILQRKATDENYTDDQIYADIAGLPDLADATVKALFRDMDPERKTREAYNQSRIEANKALADQRRGAGGNLKTYTTYQKIANDAAKALNEARIVAEATQTDVDPALVADLEGQIEYGRRGMAQSAPKESAVPESTQATPQMTSEELQQFQQDEYGKAGPVTGPPVPPDLNPYTPATLQAEWTAMTPEQRTEKYLGRPTPAETNADAEVEKILTPAAPPSAVGGSTNLPRIKNDADFDALPSGTIFIDPEGKKRTKP